MAINEDLQDQAIRHAILIEQLKNREARKILTRLNTDVLPDVLREIERRLSKGISTKRFIKLRRAYTLLIREGYKRLGIDLREGLVPIAEAEALNQIRLINQLSPIQLSLTIPSIPTLRVLANGKVRGQTVKKYFSNLAAKDANEITRQLQIGLVEGESVPELVRRIRGTREQAFTDGVLNTTRHNAETIARTAVNDITTKAREEVYKANTDVVSQVKYLATLDSRTTAICASLDGRVFNIDEGPRPPQHFNCRSTTVPIMKSFKELGIPGLNELPPATRASASKEFTGQVPATTTYPQWLKTQPASVQNEALGVGKGKLFRKGKLPDERFFNDRSKQLTLKQLQTEDKKLSKK